MGNLSMPNEAELAWLQRNLALLRELAGRPSDDETWMPTLAELDLLFGKWATATSAAGVDPNPGINAFGTAFGEHLVRSLAFEWTVASDEAGTEIAVVRQPGSVLVYPTNLVAKRYVAEVHTFFSEVFSETALAIARVEVRPPEREKPRWKFW